MQTADSVSRYTIRGIDATGNPKKLGYTRVNDERDEGEWTDFSWEIDIESTWNELRSNVEKALDRVGRDNDVFDVFDHAGNHIATEETL